MLNGKQYCRKCISFKGEEVEHKPSYPKKAPIHLEYELSPEQKELSNKLVENYKKGIDSLVFAVCESPKTLKNKQKGITMKDKFLFNKKRKHYSYIFKIRNGYCLNILLTTEAE